MLVARLQRTWPGVTVAKLRRWHSVGLIPRPRRVGLGRGRGSLSYYPAEAEEQAETVLVLLTERRNLAWVGWKLWLMDYPIAEHHWRPQLHKVAIAVDTISASLRDMLDSEDDRYEGLAKQLFEVRADNRLFRSIRKSLGARRFEEGLSSLLEMIAGYYSGPTLRDVSDEDYRHAANMMDLTLGFKRGRTDTLPDGTTFLNGDYLPILIDLAKSLTATPWVSVMDNLSTEEINAAKLELVNLLYLIHAMAQLTAANFEPGMYGLKKAGLLREELSSGNFAGAVLGWMLYRRLPGIAEQAATFREHFAAQGVPINQNLERAAIRLNKRRSDESA